MPNESLFIKLLGNIPAFAVFGRGTAVMLLFLTKRAGWQTLYQTRLKSAILLMDYQVKGNPISNDGGKSQFLQQHMAGTARVATLLGVIVVFVHFVWQFSAYLSVLIAGTIQPTGNTTKIGNTNSSYGQDQLFSQIMFYTGYAFFLSMYVLSQQVIVLGVVFTIILRSCLKRNNATIVNLRLALDSANSLCGSGDENIVIEGARLVEQLEIIRRCQNGIRILYTEVDAFFRNIFFAAHVLDMACLMGFVALVIMSDSSANLGAWLSNCVSSVIFVGYTTVLLCPLAFAYEEAESTHFQVYQLSVAIRRHFPKEAIDSQMHEILQDIMGLSEEKSIVLQGAGVINYTRSWFAGTITLTLSFSVLAYELTQRSGSGIC
ncbi:hypothetical protein BV898_01410 [Hypsibius exemplaris]|uniref:Gustatory receptor n=1 Tax=Hypsibius exemplaris TaxID=2072580 RepID=A0A1W0XC30_HYPEX|nr:hypothetical protein BV898_01410 [Hypsibius exemplaris]